MLHGIHSVYPPPSASGHKGEDPIANKKLRRGDGLWSFTKEILGWIFDGNRHTIQLPEEKCKKIIHLIRRILKSKTTPRKRLEQLLGNLQHASFGIPGGSGLFSALQMSLSGEAPFLTITPCLQLALEDWREIIHHLRRTPTSIHHLVPIAPDFLGYSDACKLGAGGVWMAASSPLPYIVWRVAFPDDIVARLKTKHNPTGDLTINDFELVGIVLEFLALTGVCRDVTSRHLVIRADNTSAVSWAYRMRTSASLPAARLLRYLGLLILAHHTSPLTTEYVPGPENDMADKSSRSFK